MDELSELLDRARELAKAREWGPEAIEVNTAILKRVPDDVASLTRRGRCYWEAAREDYDRALKLDPKNTIARNALAKMDRKAGTSTERPRAKVVGANTRPVAAAGRAHAEARRRREEAERARMSAEDLQEVGDLSSFEEARSLGIAARSGSHPNYPLAIAAFRKAFELDRRRYDVLTMLAATYRACKQLEKAEKVYRWILAHEDSTFARVGLAAVYADTKRPAKARKLYEEVLDQEPANSYALMGLGRVFYNLDLPEQAIEVFEKAAKFAEDRRTARDAVDELKKMRETYRNRGEADRAEWIDSVLDRLRAR